MGNVFVVLTPLVHSLVKLAGLTPQTIEIEPGTLMNIWVPKEIVTKNDGKTVYLPPTKPAVVLLHCFAFDGILTWFLQVLALTKDYSLYVPDFLFFGGSITDKTNRSASFQAAFVAKGLEKLRVDKVTLVGISYGGMVGFKMAKLYPQLVKSMVMSATVIEMTESISLDSNKRLGVSCWSELLNPTTLQGLKRLLSVGFHKVPWLPDFVYRGTLETMFYNRKERKELLEELVVNDKDASSDTNYSQTMFYNRIERKELSEELVVNDKDASSDTNYSQIIHLLWGADDKIFDLNHAMTMKRQLGDKTTLDWIKDAGHLVSLEKSFAYNKRLKCVLERMTKDQ